jgi:adenosylhomocysteine nucleosidase
VIINTGVAGSLFSDLRIGDCAIASSVVQYDVDTTAFGDPPGMISGINVVEFHCDPLIVEKLDQAVASTENIHRQVGLIASGDRFLKCEEDKRAILDHFKAIACEMESGSIGQVCFINQVPFGVIRAISDNADSTSCIEYGEFLNSAALMAANTVKIFLEKINQKE